MSQPGPCAVSMLERENAGQCPNPGTCLTKFNAPRSATASRGWFSAPHRRKREGPARCRKRPKSIEAIWRLGLWRSRLEASSVQLCVNESKRRWFLTAHNNKRASGLGWPKLPYG